MRYLLTFSYDGSKFHGFQRQNNVKNVQGLLEQTLSKLLNEDIVIKGSGRTDAGVHAIAQTAHFDSNSSLTQKFIDDINKALQGDIFVKKIKKVNNDFHARFSIKYKKYRYIINLDKSNLNNDYYFTSLFKLDLKRMRGASKLFIGTHDFHNFVSGDRDDYITHIKRIKISEKGNYIVLEFTGVGFYRYMVRHLVGALYDVGRDKASKEVIQKMLDKPNEKKQLTVMPASGLYLVKVKY